MNLILFMLHSYAALPTERRPSSNNLTASKKSISCSSAFFDLPVDIKRSSLYGIVSTCMIISPVFYKMLSCTNAMFRNFKRIKIKSGHLTDNSSKNLKTGWRFRVFIKSRDTLKIPQEGANNAYYHSPLKSEATG